MKQYYPLLLILLLLLTVSSCKSSYTAKSFSSLANTTSLDGTYIDTAYTESSATGYLPYIRRLSHVFGIYEDTIEFVQIKFNKESLCLLYETDAGIQKKVHKGKLKNNYFEVSLKKKLIPIPFIFFIYNNERVRLGLNEDNNLLVQYWRENQGWVLFMAGGDILDYEFVFKRIEDAIEPDN